MQETKKAHRLPAIPSRAAIAIIIKAAIILLAVLLVFYQDLTIIFTDALTSETTSYILAIPPLLAYLIYRKRKMITASIPQESSKLFGFAPINELLGTVLLALSFLLYWYGSYTFTPLEYHMLTLPIFTSACILILFNTATMRQLLFPTIFLFLLTPPPAEILYSLGAYLSTASSELATAFMKLFGFAVDLVTEDGNPVMFLTQQNGEIMRFEVDIACSGIYSQIGFFLFALFLAYLVRDKTWKKAAVLIIGFPLIYALNVLRIIIIMIIGYYQGVDLALNAFHLLGGWILIFFGTLLILATSEKLLKTNIIPKPTEKCPDCTPTLPADKDYCISCGKIHNIRFKKPTKKDLAKAFLLCLSISLILYIQAPVFALTQGPAEIVLTTPQGGNVTTQVLPQIPGYTLKFLYRDTNFEQLSKQDASLVYAYFPQNETKEILWISIEVASSRTALHRWETCLVTWPVSQGSQPRVRTFELKDTQLLDNPPITGRYFTFQYIKTNLTQAVMYWYETSVFKINSTSQQKQVKISVIAEPETPDALPNMENQIMPVATQIARDWQPIKTWSQIALMISQNGDKLVAATTAILAAICTLYLLNKANERKQNTTAYTKLSQTSKNVIEAVYHTESRTLPTLENISKTYDQVTGKTTTKEDLLQLLSETETLGITQQDIASRQDEPVQVWKTNCSCAKVSLPRIARDRIQLLINSARTGKNPSNKIKISIVWLLRCVQELSPPKTRKYLDFITHGMTIETDVKFQIRTPHDFFIFSSLWEKELKDTLKFTKGMNFLDVGAHIGKYTLRAAAKIGNQGKVIAIEPDRNNFALLVRNIELNKLHNCIPLNLAAYSTDGEVNLFLGPSSAEHSITEDSKKGSYKVKAKALDNVLNEIRIEKVDLIKIDVEGAELEVLKGLRKTLKKDNPTLVIELLKTDRNKIINYLADLGYKEKLLHVYLPYKGGLMYYRFTR